MHATEVASSGEQGVTDRYDGIVAIGVSSEARYEPVTRGDIKTRWPIARHAA